MSAVEASQPRVEDQRIVLRNVSWSEYDAMLAIRGDDPGVRLTYLEGELELMSPSIDHELIKKTIARLVEAFSEERGIDLIGYGSWTVRQAARARGLEPDECYVLGAGRPERPDLAIEVQWTAGGIDKLEVYRGLEVPEVWVWRNHRIDVHVLRGDSYEVCPTSELLTGIDLARLAAFVRHPNQAAAVREYRRSLRGAK